MKLKRINGFWIVEDRGVNKIFETSLDAWTYIFIMKEIRPKAPEVPKSLYPVRSLNPMPTRGCKKVVILQNR
jgi:hypothetical protein